MNFSEYEQWDGEVYTGNYNFDLNEAFKVYKMVHVNQIYVICVRQWDGISKYSFNVIEAHQDENEAIDVCAKLNRNQPNPKISFFYEQVDFVSYSHILGTSTDD